MAAHDPWGRGAWVVNSRGEQRARSPAPRPPELKEEGGGGRGGEQGSGHEKDGDVKEQDEREKTPSGRDTAGGKGAREYALGTPNRREGTRAQSGEAAAPRSTRHSEELRTATQEGSEWQQEETGAAPRFGGTWKAEWQGISAKERQARPPMAMQVKRRRKEATGPTWKVTARVWKEQRTAAQGRQKKEK